jgi:hypothetical protein
MKNAFSDFGILSSTFFPLFFLVFAILWRLRAYGQWTLVLPFVFLFAFLLLGNAFFPHALYFHYSAFYSTGPQPMEQGFSFGCGMPAVLLFVHDRVTPGRKAP